MTGNNINQTGNLSSQDKQVNNSNLSISKEDNRSLDCHEKPEEWWEIHNSEYIHYVYKITNKINEMFYYGIHSTLKSLKKEPINDGYWGSGTGIREAIKKEGIENFTKEIVVILNTRQEIRKKEAEIVTINLVKDPKCYNRVIGGGDSPLGKVCVFLKDDPTSKAFLIDREEYYNNQEIYKTTTEQNVIVKLKTDEEGNWFLVTKEEYRQNKDKYETPSSGKVAVYLIDENGDVNTDITKIISIEEYHEYKNIKYVHVGFSAIKGKVIVFNKNDPERKAICMSNNDPRYLSGEFIGITNGIKQSKETVAKKIGEKNGSFGSIWITNGQESRKIYDGNIPEGWRKGRIMSKSARETMRSSNAKIGNKRVYDKIIDNQLFSKNDFNDDLSIKKEKLKDLYNLFNRSWRKLSKELNIHYCHINNLRSKYESEGFIF